MNGLQQIGPVVVLTDSAVRLAYECVLMAYRQRRLSGYPTGSIEQLAQALNAAMSAGGHSDVRESDEAQPVHMEPTVPLEEAATRLGVCHRQARRLAPRLGGKKRGGRWFVDEIALCEHLEGK